MAVQINCSDIATTTSVSLDSGSLGNTFCHEDMQTTYDEMFTLATANFPGGAFVVGDGTPDSGDQNKLFLKLDNGSNCMPKGWYIYDANKSTTDKWRNFMSTPAGSMTMFGGAAAPEGWLMCDGTAYSTTTYPEYEDLFAAIANTYGGSSGADFKVPDLGGRVPVGKASSGTFDTLNGTGGVETHALTTEEMPAHPHTLAQVWAYLQGTPNSVEGSGNSGTISATGSTGGGEAHTNLQPYIVVNYIIKY